MNRNALLEPYYLLDSLPEGEYDAITEMAATICHAPIAMVALIAKDRQYYKSHYGIAQTDGPLENSFSQVAIQTPDRPLIVKDARKDSRFKDFEAVKSEPYAVFYIGIPLMGSGGKPLGTLSVIDHHPRELEEEKIRLLKKLVTQVEKLFELRRSKWELSENSKKLAEKATRLENIIESTEAGTWEWDLTTDILAVSNRWASMFGYERDELQPLTFKKYYELTHPEYRDKVGKELQRLIAGEIERYDIDVRMQYKEGNYIYVNSRGKIVERSPLGKPLKIFGANLNITEKKVEEELRLTNEKRFKALVQDGSDLISIVDEEGYYIYVSPPTERILGNPPEFYLGKKAFDFIHPDDQERVMHDFEQLNSTNHRAQLEPFRFADGQGNWRWMDTVVTNLLDDPAVNGIVASSRDITERREEERHRHLLESVVVNAHDAVLITEAEPLEEPGPRILYVNDAFTKMTGYTLEEIKGKNPRMLQGPDSDRKELKKLGKALRENKPHEVTTVNYKKSGEKFWVNFTTIPVMDAKGVCTHYIAIERDVSRQLNQEREKKLIADIGEIFNRSEDLHSCLVDVLDHIIDFDSFKIAEVWLPGANRTRLILSAQASKNTKSQIFYEASAGINSFLPGEGAPGTVFAKGEDVFWDLEEEKEGSLFIRQEAAKKAGIRTAIGIPLIHHDKIKGVLLLGSSMKKEELTHLHNLLQELRYFFGAEIKRKKLESDLKALFEAAPDIIAISNYEGYFVRINPAAERLLGYTTKELTGQPYTTFIHPDDHHTTSFENWQAAGEKTNFNFENRYITADGKTIWLNWTVRIMPERELLYSVAKDVTEIKEAEESRIKLLDEKTAILESLGDGFFSVDRNWTVRYWNRFAEAFLNVKREDVIDKNLLNLFENVVSAEFLHCLKKANETKKKQQVVEYYPASESWFEVNAYPSEDGLSVFFRDISDRMEHIKFIESQNEKLRDIAFEQSHVVRAPLTRIMGLTSLLTDDGEKDKSEQDELLDLLKESADELDEVIHEIVQKTNTADFSPVRSGKKSESES